MTGACVGGEGCGRAKQRGSGRRLASLGQWGESKYLKAQCSVRFWKHQQSRSGIWVWSTVKYLMSRWMVKMRRGIICASGDPSGYGNMTELMTCSLRSSHWREELFCLSFQFSPSSKSFTALDPSNPGSLPVEPVPCPPRSGGE